MSILWWDPGPFEIQNFANVHFFSKRWGTLCQFSKRFVPLSTPVLVNSLKDCLIGLLASVNQFSPKNGSVMKESSLQLTDMVNILPTPGSYTAHFL